MTPGKQHPVRKAQAMATKAGVWIDHRQAIVVLITEEGQQMEKVKSGTEQPVRPAGNLRGKKKYTPNDFIAEDRQDRKVAMERKKFYDEVLARIRTAGSLLIVGPGEAKGEFSKQVTAKKRRGLAMRVETAGRMSDRQIASKVSEYFAKTPLAKSAAPKMKGKPKPKKRTKKFGN